MEVWLQDAVEPVDTGLLDEFGNAIYRLEEPETVPMGFHFYGRPTQRTRKKARR